MTYISKQDAVNKGLIRKNGRIFKLSVLEVWYKKGYLDYNLSKYSANDRLEFGLRLALDFQIINRANLRSGCLHNIKIDNMSPTQSSSLLNALHRYNSVIRSIPSEFWPIIRRICIEDKDLLFPKTMSERQKNYYSYLNRIDLCRGLDRVIDAYTKKLNIYKNGN